MVKISRKTSQDRILTVAYSIILGVFKKISTKKRALKHLSLKSSDKAKCNICKKCT